MRTTLVFLLALRACGGDSTPRAPMTVRFEDTAPYRWLQKKVLDSRLLDDMEDPSRWRFSGKGELTFTEERARDGAQSLRIHTHAEPAYDPSGRVRGWVSANAIRRFDSEDWSNFNRLSFWIYPDLPGFRNVAVTARLATGDKPGVPEGSKRDYLHYFNLRNQQWNRVVWEIAPVARTKVTGLTFQYIMNGKQQDATGEITLDIDHLELERVEPDHAEGWNVAPGRISYSHSGYQPGASKTAIASGLEAREFQLVSQATGEAVLSKPVREATTHLGRFQVLDFSEVREPGAYVLRAGDAATRPFRIGHDVWRDSILKALNFFYVERCGTEIPGVHRLCHGDWQGVHGDKKVVINGGWHDAGDLSQGPVNTAEAAYAMFDLAERLRARGEDPELEARLLEEARWGLDWVLKTQFGDGYRVSFSALAFWTNGVLGDGDDVVSRAVYNPYENFLAAAAEALAARVLKAADPELAARSLRVARDDWRFAMAAIDAPDGRRRFGPEAAGAAVLASLDLFRATGEAQYGDQARELAEVVLGSQQRSYLPGVAPPLAGFFYTTPARDRILHYEHRGHEQAPVVALARLCETFPEHQHWMRWYAGVALHSQYLRNAARFTEPYGMLPASVYREDEWRQAPEERRESYRRQIENGIEIGKGYRLRLFPAWYAYRGNHGTLLSQTKAISTAAQLRGDLELAGLAQKQFEWVAGRNPFSASTIYGEGYDSVPLYTPSSGDIVGAFPVGIYTREDRDVPYWPPSNSYVYKEVWVHPAARWIYAMRDAAGGALATGRTAPGEAVVEFREAATAKIVAVRPDPRTGSFRAVLPEGRYTVRCGAGERTATLLAAGTVFLDLRPGHVFDFTLAGTTRPDGRVTIRLAARGQGTHRFAIRADNLQIAAPERTLDLTSAREITWQGKVSSADAPWVAVVVPDGDLAARQEVSNLP
jgi:hypothetical protein